MAGFGNITGYEEGPAPGSYNFTKADGSKMLFAGPAAEDLKEKLDKSAKLGPQPTANFAAPNQSSMPRNVADVGPNMSAAPPAAPPPSGKNWGGMFTAPPPAAPQGFGPAPAPQGAPQPQRQEAPPGATELGYGLRVNPQGVIEQWQPGQAATKGGPVEKGRTIAGGYDSNEEYLQRKEDTYLNEQGAIATGMEAAKEQALQQNAFFDEQKRQMMAREAEARAQQEQIAKGVAELETKHEQARKDYTGSKVNPNKIFGGGRNWAMGLAAGFGGFASVINNRPNSAIAIMENRIAQNIAAQERNIAIKGETADNALADLTRKLGSQDLARKALADIQLDQFKLAMQKQASSTNDKELESKYLMMSAAAENKQLDFREQYRQAAAGHVTKSIVNTPGSGGRAAGFAPVKDQLGTAGKLKDLNAVPKGEGGGELRPLPTERTDKISAYADSIAAADEIDQLTADKEGTYDDPTAGPIDRLIPSDEKNKLNAATSRLAKGAQAARGKSDKDAELAEQDAKGTGSYSDRKRGAATVRAQAVRGIVGEIVTLPPEQQKTVLENLPPNVRTEVLAGLKGGQ
jgi:hypothetical protein